MQHITTMLELWRQTRSPLTVVRHYAQLSDQSGAVVSTKDADWQKEDEMAYRDLAELVDALEIWKGTLEIEKSKLKDVMEQSEKTISACLSYQKHSLR